MYLKTCRNARARRLTPLVVVVLLLGAFPALADDDESWEQALEELFLSDVVFPQERGEIQVTLGTSRSERQEAERWQVPLTLEYGITDRFQIELEWDGYVRDELDGPVAVSDGFGDAEIGASYSWMEVGGTPWHVAAGIEVPVELGDGPGEEIDEGEEDEDGVEPFFVVARDLRRWRGSQISFSGGVEIGDEEKEWFAGLAGFVPVRSWVLTAEINWAEEASYWTPGIVWHPGGEWELGVGLPIGLGREADDWRWIAVLTYEFEPLG